VAPAWVGQCPSLFQATRSCPPTFQAFYSCAAICASHFLCGSGASDFPSRLRDSGLTPDVYQNLTRKIIPHAPWCIKPVSTLGWIGTPTPNTAYSYESCQSDKYIKVDGYISLNRRQSGTDEGAKSVTEVTRPYTGYKHTFTGQEVLPPF
jgi:hypothetical protein